MKTPRIDRGQVSRTITRVLAALSALAVLVGLNTVPPVQAAAVTTSSSTTTTGPRCPGSASSRLVFDPIPEGSTPVIFTHGWTGSIDQLQGLGRGVEQLVDGDISVRYFDYYADSVRWAAEPQIAACLAEYLHEASRQAGRPAVVVAHSMGGLAVRFASSGHYADQPITRDQVSDVVTIATPHRGSPWGGEIASDAKQTWEILKSKGVMPFYGAAATCLARHDSEYFIDAECDAPPYLPPGVNLRQIEGANLVTRQFLGHTLWTIDHRGDGIVLTDSATGYPGSAGLPSPTGYRLEHKTVTCDAHTNDQKQGFATLLRSLDESLLVMWLRSMVTERATMDSILAGRLDGWSAPAWGSVAGVSRCSHTAVVEHPETVEHVAEVASRAVRENQERPDSRTDSSTISDALIGTWTGDIHQPGAQEPDYTVRAEIRQEAGRYSATVTYPEQECSGTWEETGRDVDTVLFTETITANGRCVAEVPVAITPLPGGALGYFVDYGDGATGVLQRQDPDLSEALKIERYLYEVQATSEGPGISGKESDAHFSGRPMFASTTQWVSCTEVPSQTRYDIEGWGNLHGEFVLRDGVPEGLRAEVTVTLDGIVVAEGEIGAGDRMPLDTSVASANELVISARTSDECGSGAAYGVLRHAYLDGDSD